MNNARTLTALFAIMLLSLVATPTTATESVSPGAVDRVAVVETRCPTFSWGITDGAAAYDLAAYVLPENAAQQVELTAGNDVLFTRVAGSATSWTPSAEQCFAPGGRYVWFVRAVTELAGDQVIEAGEWSAGRFFEVPAAPSAEEMARALEVLKRWEAAGGGGEESAFPAGTRSGGASPTLRRSGWGGVLSGADAGSAAPKSVPTASAAIRGEHPDTAGEKYGVVGTSASPGGAGLAAANLDGGPDLVLDGSADSEPDARLYEWGLERESATDWNFQFINPGAGALNLEVDGMVSATGLDCPDCVTSAEIVNLSITGADLADDSVSGAKIADSAVGGTHLATGAVSSAKILDGTIAAADLADNAVTDVKIAAGAVGANAIHGSAVTTAALADDAVTGAKIAAGAVANAQLADNAVTGGKIEDGAVRNADLGANAVTTDKIADGTITAADVDLNGGLYVSKTQPYQRQESTTWNIADTVAQIDVACDDANDLPLTGWCEVNDPSFETVDFYGEYWDTYDSPAEFYCEILNRLGNNSTATATILCLSVP